MMDMHVEMSLDSENVIDSSSLDPLFEEAARIIVTMRSGFASLIQRRLSIGYNRAVRIMDQLEEAGVVGPDMGTKPREVKMSASEFEHYLNPNQPVDIGCEEEYPVSEDF